MRHLAFKSLVDLGRDVRQWLDVLPRDYDIVAGVPRSGLLVANLISLYRHLHVADIEGLLAGRLLGGGKRFESGDVRDYLSRPRRVLVVDDSLLTGTQLSRVRESLSASPVPHEFSFGCVYVVPGKESLVDHFHESLPYPRIFEWNLMHHPALEAWCMDIDGVLCRDPTEEENDDGVRYLEFLSSIGLRARPTFRVGTLVTSRLERYRPQTEEWLQRNGIRYDRLIMMPYDSKAERLAAGRHGRFKAEAYTASGAMVFIESDAAQAQEIADISLRPVICTDRMRLCLPRIITKNDIIAGLRRARTPARQFRWLRSHRRAIGYWLTRRWARGSRSA